MTCGVRAALHRQDTSASVREGCSRQFRIFPGNYGPQKLISCESTLLPVGMEGEPPTSRGIGSLHYVEVICLAPMKPHSAARCKGRPNSHATKHTDYQRSGTGASASRQWSPFTHAISL